MKKIFSLMLMLALALFAGVSCTNDQTGDENPPVDPVAPVVTVTGVPEDVLAPEAGSFTLNYTIENATMTGVLDVTTEATWLTKGEDTGAAVTFAYEANTDAPGTPAREAVITFAYEGAEPVAVTVKQETAAATFSVEFSNATMNSANAMLTSTDPEIDWLALCYTSSQIEAVGTPLEYINDLYNSCKSEGFPYLYMANQIGMRTSGSMGKGSATEPFMCMLPYTAAPTDKLYLFVLGYNVDADINDWSYDNSTLNGPIHIFEVPLIPAPVVNIATLENTVTSEQGTLDIDVTIENAVDGAIVNLETQASWVTPSYADGKLTLAYEANTAALPRSATITLDYVKMVSVGEPGTEEYYEYPEYLASHEISLTQEADANAEKVTFEIEVVEEHNLTHFNRLVVNIKPSDENVEYLLNTVSAHDYSGELREIDWMNQINNDTKYGVAEEKVFKGELNNHSIILYPQNYNSETPQYYVYAFALNEDKTAPAGEASHLLATVDLSDMPVVTWDVEKSGLTLNAQERYEIKVEENSTVTLYFNVANAVEGASLKLNDDGDSGILAEEPVVDNEAGTVTFKIAKFNPYNSYHYARPGFQYSISPNDMWGCESPDLQLTLNIPTTGKALPYEESFYDGIGDFTITDSWLSTGLSYIWKHDSYHYMKASAYVSGTGYTGTSYLVSPVISLANATAPELSFTHCVNHCAEEFLTQTCKLMVKEVSANSWTTLTIPTHGTGTGWDWKESGAIDLSAYAGKNIVIAFVYSSVEDWNNYNYETGTCPIIAPTWEVKNFKVAEK